MTAGVVDDDDGDVTTDSHTNQKTLFRRGWGIKAEATLSSWTRIRG